ncbi:MAG: hypothetical protein A3F14_05325 [Gammaproteobacteria bacterium RIFCSPHIGHO2_12_FULL_43_28]|nr:MAG: hypothetical protein A3F14_05325 [Gammaproteobacteria bacterium RIFCSPHIGHO2_12_FULL_43_28]
MSEHHKTKSTKSPVQVVTITEANAGQRIDNFLLTYLKGLPKSRIYRLLRKGEVRVNMKRISPFYKLLEGDAVRLPPVYLPEKAVMAKPAQDTIQLLLDRIIYEDDELLILNKPSGMSVHAGSTVRVGVVEALRHAFPKLKQLELAHRLDAETSGCLVLAKKKRVLRELHALLREGQMMKLYWALTQGRWKKADLRVDLPLHKHYRDGGKHLVEVRYEGGKAALTLFSILKAFKNATLVEAKLMTGRTHQIRVHAAQKGHPIAGDDRYGDLEFNKAVRKMGVKRLFLHAKSIDFTLPSNGKRIRVTAPLDAELEAVISRFDNDKSEAKGDDK